MSHDVSKMNIPELPHDPSQDRPHPRDIPPGFFKKLFRSALFRNVVAGTVLFGSGYSTARIGNSIEETFHNSHSSQETKRQGERSIEQSIELLEKAHRQMVEGDPDAIIRFKETYDVLFGLMTGYLFGLNAKGVPSTEQLKVIIRAQQVLGKYSNAYNELSNNPPPEKRRPKSPRDPKISDKLV